MKAGEPDIESLRGLFTELEFTSLLKELLPVVQITAANYTEAQSAADVEAALNAVEPDTGLAVAVECDATPKIATDSDELEEPDEAMLPLAAEPAPRSRGARKIAISVAPGTAVTVSLE